MSQVVPPHPIAPARLRAVLLASLALLLVAAVLLGAAPPASAAPTEPTLTTAELQALLDASPPPTGLPGSFKTVMSGSTITDIPATVLSVVPGAGPDGIPLILFEAPSLDALGGVVAGMSGSPLYVDDGGTDKLIGAVSYGDWFTLNGTGLATPIEWMSKVEDDYMGTGATTTVKFDNPIKTSAGLIEAIAVAPSTRAARRITPQKHTAVMAPLATVAVGGMPHTSKVFDKFVERMAAHGLDVQTGPAAAYDAGFTTPLEPGAAVADMLTRGDTWEGGVGTVTYVHDDVLVAFGHPFLWMGATGTELCNAYVHGIWPSSIEPYKLASPGALRGTFTEDRRGGISGLIGALPTEVPVTSQVTVQPSGATFSSTSYVAKWVADQSDFSYDLAWPIATGIWQATDMESYPGHMTGTITVVVSDGTQEYTVTRSNVWDSRYGVDWEPVDEAYLVIDRLLSDPYGIYPGYIKSVDFKGEISPIHKSAAIVDVAVPGGLKVGANDLAVTLRVYGQQDLQTVNAGLTIPKGTPARGRLAVMGARGGWWDDWGYYGYSGYFDDTSTAKEPPTLADRVAGLADYTKNDALDIFFTPDRTNGDGSDQPETIEANLTTDWYVHGYVEKRTPRLSLSRVPRAIGYGDSVMLRGWLWGPREDSTVNILRRTAGAATETTLATVPADYRYGVARFHYGVRRLTKNGTLAVAWDGNDNFLAGKVTRTVHVRARVTLRLSRIAGHRLTLKGGVFPEQPSATVWLEELRGGNWVKIKRDHVTLASGFGFTWSATSGSHAFRAHFSGSTINLASNSAPVKVTVP